MRHQRPSALPQGLSVTLMPSSQSLDAICVLTVYAGTSRYNQSCSNTQNRIFSNCHQDHYTWPVHGAWWWGSHVTAVITCVLSGECNLPSSSNGDSTLLNAINVLQAAGSKGWTWERMPGSPWNMAVCLPRLQDCALNGNTFRYVIPQLGNNKVHLLHFVNRRYMAFAEKNDFYCWQHKRDTCAFFRFPQRHVPPWRVSPRLPKGLALSWMGFHGLNYSNDPVVSH